jgi:hypothetical protein
MCRFKARLFSKILIFLLSLISTIYNRDGQLDMVSEPQFGGNLDNSRALTKSNTCFLN